LDLWRRASRSSFDIALLLLLLRPTEMEASVLVKWNGDEKSVEVADRTKALCKLTSSQDVFSNFSCNARDQSLVYVGSLLRLQSCCGVGARQKSSAGDNIAGRT
jgi:hypothetical protein